MKKNCSILAMVIATTLVFVAACNEPTSEDRKLGRLETEVVRADIEDQKFDVPIRYMYGDAIEKLGSKHWPKAKEGRVKVDYIHISLLMPELKAYFPEDDGHWKDRTYGGRMHVSLTTNGQGDWFEMAYRLTAEDGYYRKEADKYGLTYFASPTRRDHYFSQDGRRLAMSCENETQKDPASCMVKSNYRDGLAFEYYVHRKYMPQWQQIDDKLKSLFDQFSASAQINSDK